jgi:hypothetical protein
MLRILFIFFISIVTAYQIINNNKPICKKCIYFDPAPLLYKDEAIKYGYCKYYGNKDILNGKISYEYASIARKNKDCGENGTKYIKDPNYQLKLNFKLIYDIMKFFKNNTHQ